MNELIRAVSSSRTGQCPPILRRLTRFFAVVALLLWTLPGAHAQLTSADIVGVITDATGAVIPNASVTVVNLDTQEQRTVTSNSSREYQVTLLPVGRYSITVKVPASKTWSTPAYRWRPATGLATT